MLARPEFDSAPLSLCCTSLAFLILTVGVIPRSGTFLGLLRCGCEVLHCSQAHGRILLATAGSFLPVYFYFFPVSLFVLGLEIYMNAISSVLLEQVIFSLKLVNKTQCFGEASWMCCLYTFCSLKSRYLGATCPCSRT